MNIIEKKNLAMEKIMAIPLEDWEEGYLSEDSEEFDCDYVTTLNGARIWLTHQCPTMIIINKKIAVYDSRVPDLFYKVSCHFDRRREVAEIFDQICK